LFTHVDRYNYVDPDYAYTNEERLKIEKQRLVYRDYVKDLKFYREEKARTRYGVIITFLLLLLLNQAYTFFSSIK
jgi:hypothetical protein